MRKPLLKKLLKTLFYRDTPAEGAVFASLLWYLGLWCLATLFVFTGGLYDVFMGVHTGGEVLIRPWIWGIFLTAAAGLLLYHLIVTGNCYRVLFGEKHRLLFRTLGAILFAGTIGSAMLFKLRGLFFFPYAVVCWVLPLAAMPKRYKYLIPAALGPPLLILPLDVFFTAMEYRLSCYPIPRLPPATLLWDLQVKMPCSGSLSFLLGVICIFLGYKAYAEAFQKPFLSMFGRGAKALILLFLLVYSFSLGMAFSAHRKTERSVALLERRFGRPVNAEGLKDLYLGKKGPDEKFWEKVQGNGGFGFDLKYYDILTQPKKSFPPEQIAGWKKELETSRKLPELEKAFSSEIPPFPRDFQKGWLGATELPEHRILREFARCEAWRVRFALDRKEPEGAVAALERMTNVRNYLAKDPMTVYTMALITVETLRIDALEVFMRSGQAPASFLRARKEELSSFRKEMKVIFFRALYGDAVMMMDLCDTFSYGCPEQEDLSSMPALYPLRFLFPAGWYLCTQARKILADFYVDAVNGDSPVYKREISFADVLVHSFVSGADMWGIKFQELSDRYAAMERLIGELFAENPAHQK
ncbi:MAG: hypothetical protein J6331_03495 [Lentisphaeria bacterium]|nr:hypothetical protein [Lentisphaeria bacterium]